MTYRCIHCGWLGDELETDLEDRWSGEDWDDGEWLPTPVCHECGGDLEEV